MSSIGTGYDLGLSYSPDGRIFQAEYAMKAVEAGGTVIGIKVKDGVLLVRERPATSVLVKPDIGKWLVPIDRHIGLTFTGFMPDGRHIIKRAREEAESWRQNYKFPIPGSVLAERIGGYKQVYTAYSSVRPFGIATFISSYDDSEGAKLYMIEPTGAYWSYHGTAAGKGRQIAKNELEKLDLQSLDLNEAVKRAVSIMHATHEDGKENDFEIEMSYISEAEGVHKLVPASQIKEAIQELQREDDDDIMDE